MGLHRLSVGQRLVAGFLVVVFSMIAVTALGFTLLGEALREALDPKSRR